MFIAEERFSLNIQTKSFLSKSLKLTPKWQQWQLGAALLNILYVSKLDVNLLSEKWMCEKDLWESFNTQELYMHNENDKLVLKTSQKDDVYVVKHIAKRLNEFALLTMYQWCEHKTAYSSQVTELTDSDLSV